MRRFVFVGVQTAGSSIRAIFPVWRDRLELGKDVELDGVDIPLDAPRSRYRAVVEQLCADPAFVGALVTTHKVAVFEAARDLFGEVDRFAQLCGEVSCLARRDGKLLGWAKDPIAARNALDDLLGPGYFERSRGDGLCIGAGGAGIAIALCLMTREPADVPARLVFADAVSSRLELVRSVRDRVGSEVPLELHATGDQGELDVLVAGLAPGSLVINATGMGKDRPGSPLTDAVRFPDGGVAWDLNYRGSLDFLRRARAQAAAAELRVEDGWRYFIFGWTSVIEEVFLRPLSLEDVELLAADAAFARPSPVASA